jgi:hypothetical protein
MERTVGSILEGFQLCPRDLIINLSLYPFPVYLGFFADKLACRLECKLHSLRFIPQEKGGGERARRECGWDRTQYLLDRAGYDWEYGWVRAQLFLKTVQLLHGYRNTTLYPNWLTREKGLDIPEIGEMRRTA